MDLENMDKWAKVKGVKVLGTGDFTHPLWFKELKEKLEPAEPGLFKFKKRSQAGSSNGDWLANSANQDKGTRFLLTSEISCIYSKNNRTRKIHIVVLAPDFQTVEKINTRLGWIGNLKADGRPILGLDAKELVKIVLNTSENCFIIPAHIWTPWFSLFGANSGFDSLRECFEEYSQYIYAAETGLSSDPAMNWRWSALDRLALVSNSDAHSPTRIGREANLFETELSYPAIVQAIKNKNRQKFLETIEFFPEEGRYHHDGHRNCQVHLTPEQARRLKNVCPRCGKPLTVGVLHRIDDLADRQEGERPEQVIPFKKFIPLEEIIAEAKGVGVGSKLVREEYKNMIKRFGSELKILSDVSPEQVERAGWPELAEGIKRVHQAQVQIEPGYDGEYGRIKIFKDGEQGNFSKQASLF